MTFEPDMHDLIAASVGDVALGVILGLCVLVMLLPLFGVAFALRDVLRQRRTERQAASEAHAREVSRPQ